MCYNDINKEKIMKCMKNKNSKEIKRVSDEDADDMAKKGTWDYCPKVEWKKNNNSEYGVSGVKKEEKKIEKKKYVKKFKDKAAGKNLEHKEDKKEQ